jgi:hypothetical protein
MNKIGKSSSFFTRFAKAASHTMGHPAAFIAALGVIVVWGITGPPVWVQRYLAAGYKYGNYNRYISDGIPDSKHTKPGYCGDPAQTR